MTLTSVHSNQLFLSHNTEDIHVIVQPLYIFFASAQQSPATAMQEHYSLLTVLTFFCKTKTCRCVSISAKFLVVAIFKPSSHYCFRKSEYGHQKVHPCAINVTVEWSRTKLTF